MRQIYRIVSDPEGKQRKIRNMSEIHRAGDETELLERRDAALQTLRETREDLVAELANVTPALAFRADKWSIMHILWHLGARGSHIQPAKDIVEKGVTEVSSIPKREERVAEGIRLTLGEIDDAIAFTEQRSAAELAMHAKRVNRDVYVVGIIEGTAEHFVDHLEQIRELKRELGVEVAGGKAPAGTAG
jgi:hypothetical protein